MSRASRIAWSLLVVLGGACSGSSDDPPPTDDDGGVPDPPDRHPGDFVFAPDVLHEVQIEITEEDAIRLESDRDTRVSCTFTFDGIRLENVGIRQKGQGTHSGSIYVKPSLSVKFDEFEEGQDLDGLEKLIFDNASADPTLLNEVLGFGIYRRAGEPAQRAGLAVITLVGLSSGPITYGVHAMVEAVDPVFMRNWFGAANGGGNIYEDEARGDFGTGPELVDLKDEDQGRSREHLVEVARILQETPAEDLVAELSPHFDLERAISSFALDQLIVNWDGFWTAAHNYYLYDNPGDGRFVLIPHGLDLLFGGYCPAADTATSLLGQRILEVPELRDQLNARRQEILDTSWDGAELQAQIAAYTALLDSSAHDEPAFLDDVRLHHESIEQTALAVVAIDSAVEGPAVCGNGALEREEMCTGGCDDGNRIAEDGCSAICVREFCGDMIVQPGLGEVCDAWGECNSACTGPIECGDGFIDGYETCDDANDDSEDGCSSDCQLEYCGDGETQPGLGEGCDGQSRCRADCSGFIPCGDGNIEWPEYCDDGNDVDGDGCTNECEANCETLTNGGWTYELCLAETPQDLAVAICSHVGGAPISPRTVEEDDWIRMEAAARQFGPWWIGVEASGDAWVDTSGGGLRMDAWAEGEPSGSGDCAVTDPDVVGWDDRDCAERHPVICRR